MKEGNTLGQEGKELWVQPAVAKKTSMKTEPTTALTLRNPFACKWPDRTSVLAGRKVLCPREYTKRAQAPDVKATVPHEPDPKKHKEASTAVVATVSPDSKAKEDSASYPMKDVNFKVPVPLDFKHPYMHPKLTKEKAKDLSVLRVEDALAIGRPVVGRLPRNPEEAGLDTTKRNPALSQSQTPNPLNTDLMNAPNVP